MNGRKSSGGRGKAAAGQQGKDDGADQHIVGPGFHAFVLAPLTPPPLHVRAAR